MFQYNAFNLFIILPQKTDDEDIDMLNHEEDFSLPQSFFGKEES